jgi:hypothetical protein
MGSSCFLDLGKGFISDGDAAKAAVLRGDGKSAWFRMLKNSARNRILRLPEFVSM